MKLIILITVIESLALMSAILYFHYGRSQSRKRSLVPGHLHPSITKQQKAGLKT